MKNDANYTLSYINKLNTHAPVNLTFTRIGENIMHIYLPTLAICNWITTKYQPHKVFLKHFVKSWVLRMGRETEIHFNEVISRRKSSDEEHV